jgi:phosphopantetheine adenylyltransferase
VSSSRLKEVAELGGDIGGLVTSHVLEALHKKLGMPA